MLRLSFAIDLVRNQDDLMCSCWHRPYLPSGLSYHQFAEPRLFHCPGSPIGHLAD
tara:strand:- start:91382 stop:91546 length:165 start_codon:yes stop_codon:yes gene_type:complete